MKLKNCMINDLKMMFLNKRYFAMLCLLLILLTGDTLFAHRAHIYFITPDIGLLDIVFLGNPNGIFGTSFDLLMPIIVIFPISNYLYQEKHGGYNSQILSRVGRGRYHLSKYLSTFSAGFLLIFLVLITNLLLALTFFSDSSLYSNEMLFTSGSAFEGFFNNNIIFYYIIYILMRSIVAGLITSCAYLVNIIFNFKNEIYVLLIPMIFLTLQSIILTFVSPYHDILQVIQINTRFGLRLPLTEIIIIQVFASWSIISFVCSTVAYVRLRESI